MAFSVFFLKLDLKLKTNKKKQRTKKRNICDQFLLRFFVVYKYKRWDESVMPGLIVFEEGKTFIFIVKCIE